MTMELEYACLGEHGPTQTLWSRAAVRSMGCLPAERSLAVEPVLRDLERPDLAAQRHRVTARNPDPVLEHIRGVLVARLPDHLGFQPLPILPIPRIPYVSPILRGMVRPAAENPDPIPVDDRREPDPRVPRRRIRHLFPVDTIGRAPDVVERAVFGLVIPSAENPDLLVVDDRRMVGPRRPPGVLRRQLPVPAIRRVPDVVLE